MSEQLKRTFARLLRDWRRLSGMTQEALAAEAAVSASIISLYERAEASPTLASLESIASAFGITVVTLLTDPETIDPAERFPVADWRIEQLAADLVTIPELQTTCPGQGTGIQRYRPVPRRLTTADGCFALRINDDAMSPDLLQGDVVVVDPTTNDLGSGDLVVVQQDGAPTVRRLLDIRQGRVLTPFNRQGHGEIKLTSEHTLLGRVVGLAERIINT